MIKQVLVPTDFSENARRAFYYAIPLALHTGAEIVLLHCYDEFSSPGAFAEVQSYLRRDATEQLNTWIQEAEPLLLGKVRVEAQLSAGESVDGIVGAAAHCDLIVMGTQGLGAWERLFTGSVTNGVVRAAEKPVLVVPPTFSGRNLTHVVLALDGRGTPGIRQVLQPLQELLQVFSAKLQVFHLEKDVDHQGLNDNLSALWEGLTYSLHVDLGEQSFLDSIRAFISEEKADLLCLIHRPRSLFAELFQPSATEKVLFHSDIPLLILKASQE